MPNGCDDYDCGGGTYNPPPAAANPTKRVPLTTAELADWDFIRLACRTSSLDQLPSGYLGHTWQVRYQVKPGGPTAAVTNALRSEALRVARLQVEGVLAAQP